MMPMMLRSNPSVVEGRVAREDASEGSQNCITTRLLEGRVIRPTNAFHVFAVTCFRRHFSSLTPCYSEDFSRSLRISSRSPMSIMACSHSNIAALLIKIYTLMIAIGYIDSTDIRLPPHDPQVFPADAYRAQNVSDRAIDFILSIPWMISGRHCLPSHTWSMNWSDGWAPEISRIPDMYDMPETAEDLMVDCSDDERSWCYEPLRAD